MNIEFNTNEFTTREVLDYMRGAYGTQINGSPFVFRNVNNWIKMGKIPVAYGGHKVLNVASSQQFKSRVITLEGLTRDLLNDLHLIEFKPSSKALPKTKTPRKHRTKLYYDILKKAGKQYTKKTLSILPDNWKEIGIKGNQLAKTRYRKVK